MKNNVLFTVTDLKLITRLKEKGIDRFVYPLSFFCVGIPKTFSIEDIKEENAYLFVNRVLNCEDIDKLSDVLHHLPKNIKGIIFDDVGLIEVCQDLDIEKILYLSHFNTNYASINYYFDYVDDIIVSTDITEKEIDEIIAKAKKKVSLFAFGLISSLYSRRSLLTSYATYNDIEYKNQKELHIGEKKFIGIENEYGMMMYHYPYFNGTRLLHKDVHYLFYFPILLDADKVVNVSENNFEGIDTDEGFLDNPTIYKVKRN